MENTAFTMNPFRHSWIFLRKADFETEIYELL